MNDRWRGYQEIAGVLARALWSERAMIRLWLDYARSTHRDPNTLLFLERCLVRGRWSESMLDLADRLADRVNIDYLQAAR